ncbi:hypothetical protein J437_LFUL013272 [Ladona fulva]|uniref:Uncharacterized protein n=1 Tax=Ladona fulva TaxID=123851 RepID=A0A8K0KJ26_LADFU|nr:hypothetical protein J437_LFUL013272 [Ladona fulva]
MYIPQQLQQQGAGAGGMAVPPLHAAMMHPPPIGLSPHPQPVPMPNMTNQPQQMNNGMQQGFMGIPSNQSMQSNNSVPMGAYPYQQFSPAGNGPAGTGSATLPAVSYPIYRQEQRPPPSGNMSTDQQQNPGGQQIIGGKTGSHKKRFTEDADHPDDGFQVSEGLGSQSVNLVFLAQGLIQS